MQLSNTRRVSKLMAGAALIALMASQGMAQSVVDEDGTVWAGGDPNFDESAGGVIEEPVAEPEPEVLVDPIEGWEGGTVDEGVIDGGGDCVACFSVGDGEDTSVVADETGASPEVIHGNTTGATFEHSYGNSDAAHDNAACISRDGFSLPSRCTN